MRRTLIPPRIPIQIQLMILLRIPPPPRFQHLRRHLSPIPLLIHLPCHLLRLPLLLLIMPENRAPILRPRIHALPILRRGVVHLVEECEERFVRDFVWVEINLQRFGVAGAAAADGAVGGAGGVAADVADFGVEEARVGEVFAEEVLNAPETAGCDGAFLGVGGEGGGGCCGGVEGEGGGCGEGAEEAGEEGGHCGGHY